MTALYVAACIVGLIVIISLHEAGHLIAAHRYKMDVASFTVGFGPTLYEKTHRNTVWRLRLIPLAGGVEIRGMTAEALRENPARAGTINYIHAVPKQRVIVAIAGPLMNVFLCWVSMIVAGVLINLDHGLRWWEWLLLPVKAAQKMFGLFETSWDALLRIASGAISPEGRSVVSLPENTESAMQATEGLPVSLTIALALIIFASVNVSVALVNLLPLYPLDGYHVVIAVIDAQRRSYVMGTRKLARPPHLRPLTHRQLRWVTAPTFGVLVGGMLYVVGGDILSRF